MHHLRNRVPIPWGEHEVDVVRHEDVRIDVNTVFPRGLLQAAPVIAEILVAMKNLLTVIATLVNVRGTTGDEISRTPGHDGNNGRRTAPLTMVPKK
jgi:hypothetical protein